MLVGGGLGPRNGVAPKRTRPGGTHATSRSETVRRMDILIVVVSSFDQHAFVAESRTVI